MNKTKKILFTMIFIFLVVVAINTKVKAVSASLSASSRDVTVGTQVTITTSIYGAAWQVNLSGAVSTAYAGYTDNAEDQTITRQTSFTPSSAGTYTVNLSGNVTGSNDDGSTQVSDSITINVRAQENSSGDSSSSGGSESSSSTQTPAETSTATSSTKSSNANLSNLGITPNDFSGFKPGTTAYSVTVPNDVDQVTVYASLQDSKASLTGTGVQKLNVGQNALNVVVTAEDGTKKTYTINVTREEGETTDENSEEEQTTEESTAPSNSDLLKLEVTGYTLTPEFSPDVYEYKLDINGDISDLDVVTEGANHNVNIEVSGNTGLQEGENVITILVYNEETQSTTTYQIIVNKINVDLEGLNTTLNNAVNKANTIRYIIAGVVALIVIGIIVFLVVRHKYKLNNNMNDDYEYDEEDKERLNLDEDEGFFSRITREVSEEPEEKPKTTTIANSIIDDIPDDSNTLEKPEDNNTNEEIEEEEDFFKTTRSKKKGKHF